jgi:hypothetical protein
VTGGTDERNPNEKFGVRQAPDGPAFPHDNITNQIPLTRLVADDRNTSEAIFI